VKTFENWCLLNGVAPIPAPPAVLARFVTDVAPLGIERVWPAVQEVSRAHYLIGLADPTLSGTVCAAINDIAKIDPPRSWPREHKAAFLRLPYDLQAFLAEHEGRREKEIHRAHGEAAELRKRLATTTEGMTNGTDSNRAA